MNLRYTILYVQNVPESLDFYTKAFGLKLRFLHEGKDYGELETGNTRLAFSSRELMQQLGKNPGDAKNLDPVFHIAFETDDVITTLANSLAAGAELVQAERQESWGQTTAGVRDPNGFFVEICSPI